MDNYFILELTYQKELSAVEQFLEAHNKYLEKYYDKGNFICSGRKNPRTGGVIICKFDSLSTVEEIIKEDPFLQNEIAKYKITEFIVTKSNKGFHF